MKFIDKIGLTHDTYIGSVLNGATYTVTNFINSKFRKPKKNSLYDEICDTEEDDCDELDDDTDEDMRIPTKESIVKKERDDLFIPGVTPKIPCNKSDVVIVDRENGQLQLKDKNGNMINITNIDSRLMDRPTKDLVNMVYEMKFENDKNE